MTDGLSEAYDMKKWDVFCENNDLLLENDQLKAENAKLRELCGLMFARLHTLVDDRWCPVFPGDEMTPYDVFDRYDELVQMGIEVDV